MDLCEGVIEDNSNLSGMDEPSTGICEAVIYLFYEQFVPA